MKSGQLHDAPNSTKRPYVSFETLKPLLEPNPSLTYISQTDNFYRVQTGDGTEILIQKNREHAPAYPPPMPDSPLAAQYILLGWALLGLLTAGTLTVILCPFIIINTFPFLEYKADVDTRIRQQALSIFISTILIFVVGILLSVLLVMHIVY